MSTEEFTYTDGSPGIMSVYRDKVHLFEGNSSRYWDRLKWKVVVTLTPKYFSIGVGDRVNATSGGPGTVTALDGGEAWVLLDRSGNHMTYRVEGLKRIE